MRAVRDALAALATIRARALAQGERTVRSLRLSVVWDRTVARYIETQFFERLIQRTDNFGNVKWLGHPIWQNILDLWVIQETIVEIRPRLIIECGTNRGGSSLFYANVCDLLSCGEIITVDVKAMHSLSHPRVAYLIGSSTSSEVHQQIAEACKKCVGPVMVILDSDHTEAHVTRELELYAPFVTPGSFCLVQDGLIDTLPSARRFRPGPLAAARKFVKGHPEFAVDYERSRRFLISHHPEGWLKRM